MGMRKNILALLFLLVGFASFGQTPLDELLGADGAVLGNYTYINSTYKASATTSTTTNAIDIRNANLIVLLCTYINGATLTVTDNDSHTFTFVRADVNSASQAIYYCYLPTPSTNSAWTATVSSALVANSIYAMAFSGAPSSPLDQSTGTIGNGSTTSAIPLTPSAANALTITLVNSYVAATPPTVSSPFTVTNSNALIGGSSYAAGAAYNIQTTLVSSSPIWTLGSTVNYTVSQVIFKK